MARMSSYRRKALQSREEEIDGRWRLDKRIPVVTFPGVGRRSFGAPGC